MSEFNSNNNQNNDIFNNQDNNPSNYQSTYQNNNQSHNSNNNQYHNSSNYYNYNQQNSNSQNSNPQYSNQQYNQQPVYKHRVPEYNFWAEQVAPQQAYSNDSQSDINSSLSQNGIKDEGKEPSKGKGVLHFVVKALCFGLLAAISFVGVQLIYNQFNPTTSIRTRIGNNSGIFGFDLPTKTYKLEVTVPGTVKMGEKSAISEVVNDTMPSIVSIRSVSTQSGIWFGQEFSQPTEGSGSGIIVGKDENELLVATNNHVVAGAQDIIVTFIDGKEANAIVKGTDAVADLAVIAIDITTMEQDTIDAIKIAKLGNSDEAKVGEMTIAIGNALGYGQSVTVGYISAKDREVKVSDGYNTKTMILLQTDAAINPGNSGGALLNAKGELIGINTIKYAEERVEGMGYAIPITRATPIINELMSREILKENEQGFLGVVGGDVTEQDSMMYNMPIGVFISEVVEDGAAAKAGILRGDIITRVNDIEVTSITQLRDYVNSIRIGTKVDIVYMRSANGEYQEHKTDVILGAKPSLNN